eukprot:1207704-Pyramimonas_sp.AAC.3
MAIRLPGPGKTSKSRMLVEGGDYPEPPAHPEQRAQQQRGSPHGVRHGYNRDSPRRYSPGLYLL